MLAITSEGLRKIGDEVEEILVKYPDARSSDEKLYGYYLYGKIDFETALNFFMDFGRISEEKHVASFGTISRLRRKAQEKHPELKPAEEILEGRDELQGTFFDFARGI